MAAKKTPYGATIRVRPRRDGTVAHDVRYRIDGASKTTSFNNAAKAKRWRDIVCQIGPVEALKLLKLDITDSSPTVDEYAERYIQSKSGLEGMTTDHYKMFMRISISPAMGTLPIDAVTPQRITDWINGQVDAGYAAKTIANRHGFLSGMFQHAVEVSEILRKNPCARTNLPNSEQEEMVFLSPDEFTQLLSYIPPYWQPLVFLIASTGLRWGEAVALKPRDFDIAHSTLRVSRAWKKSKARGWYVGAPKTTMSKRTVSVPADAMAAVLPLIKSGNEWVFVNRYGDPVRQQKFWEFAWAPARNLANGKPAFAKGRGTDEVWAPRTGGVWDRQPAAEPIGKWPRIHDLRHSHASWLINRGVPLTVIQRRLGHESVKTTSDTYGHLSPDMLQAAADVTGQVLAGAMPQLLA
jgi:integrase